MRYIATLDGQRFEIEIDGEGRPHLDGDPVDADLARIGGSGAYTVRIGTASHRVVADRTDDGVWVLDIDGRPAEVEVVDERTQRLRAMVREVAGAQGPQPVRAPMPGLVVQVDVAEGERVAEGQGIVVVEAMKMENELRADCAARVSKVRVGPGDTVEKNQVLVEFVALDDVAEST